MATPLEEIILGLVHGPERLPFQLGAIERRRVEVVGRFNVRHLVWFGLVWVCFVSSKSNNKGDGEKECNVSLPWFEVVASYVGLDTTFPLDGQPYPPAHQTFYPRRC